MMDVIGFGALNLDYIYTIEDIHHIATPEFPLHPGGEIHSRSLSSLRILRDILRRYGRLMAKSGGGSAANTIFALSRMGFKTSFIGKVGCDEEGEFIIKSLKKVSTDFVRREGRSGICIIVMDRFLDRSIFVLPETNTDINIDEGYVEFVGKSRFLHLSSFVRKRSLNSQVRLVKRLPPEVKLSLDPGEIYAEKGIKEILPLIKRSFIIFLTNREIEKLTGKGFKEGSQELLRMGPSIVVCKMGKEGSYIFSKEEAFKIPSEEVKVVDNTGAGDVYNAGFLAGLLLNQPLYHCGLFATKVAVASITGYGRSRYPTRKDLREFFKR
ncbi:MAG: carbohydrate kinase family protein [Nitrospirota bacterium]